jgi:hypothetical protein
LHLFDGTAIKKIAEVLVPSRRSLEGVCKKVFAKRPPQGRPVSDVPHVEVT